MGSRACLPERGSLFFSNAASSLTQSSSVKTLNASEIVIGEVVRKTESDFSMVECFQDGVSHCALMPSCRLKNVLADALKVFFEKLDGVTLADLMVDAQDPQAVIRTVGFSLDKKKDASVKAG
jgi:hypothetical protein